MISWTGVQISLGHEPHPLITLDLILLSLGVALCRVAASGTRGRIRPPSR